MSSIYRYLFPKLKIHDTSLSLSHFLSESIETNFLTLQSPPGIHVAEHL